MQRWERQGSTLVVVLGISLILSIQIYVLYVFTQSSFRQADRLGERTRAVAIGETAFSRVSSRLAASAWSQRWFREAPSKEEAIPFEGGSYSSHIVTVPHSTEKLADLWIEARYQRAVVRTYWRLRYRDRTLDQFVRIEPIFFSFLDEGSLRPDAGGSGPLTALIQDVMDRREANRARAQAQMLAVAGEETLAGTLAALGVKEDRSLLEDVVTAEGTLRRPPDPLGTREPLTRPGPVPASGPTDRLGQLLAEYPSPRRLPEVIQRIFRERGIPDPATTTATHFKRPGEASRQWRKAVARMDQPGQFKEMMRKCATLLNEMAKKYYDDGCGECYAALSDIFQYLEESVQRRVEEGAPSPDPDFAARHEWLRGQILVGRAIRSYGEWWKQNGIAE